MKYQYGLGLEDSKTNLAHIFVTMTESAVSEGE
jgi:hypothetical protein